MLKRFFRRSEKTPTHAKRGFDAAKVSRLNFGWTTQNNSMDWDLRTQLRPLVARSRQLCANNDYAKKFLQMAETHVVGPNGFMLQMRVMDTRGKTPQLDREANTAIEKHFWNWAKKGNCDVTGKWSMLDIQRMFIRGCAREGEFLIRKVYGKSAGDYGFQLQMLDIDRLDIDRNETLSNGNIIKMGIEVTAVGKPVAYHLLSKHPGDSYFYTYQQHGYVRVPAEDLYHCFIADRPEQTRGFPWMHSAMLRLNNLGGYEEAAIIAARVGAAKMGFFTTPDGTPGALADDEDENGQFTTHAEAGVFDTLPEGYKFEAYNPEYPTAMYGPFIKATLRGVASGMGVSYNTLSNDLEGVNFSSIRTGVLEERDNWMVVQNWMIECFMDDVFSTWLKYALLSRAITLPNGSALPVAKYEAFNNFLWIGRRWQWVDPQADIQANVIAIKNGVKSRTQICSEQGLDFEEVATQLAEEEKKLEALGIKVESPNNNQPSEPAQKPQPPKK